MIVIIVIIVIIIIIIIIIWNISESNEPWIISLSGFSKKKSSVWKRCPLANMFLFNKKL